MLMIRCLQCGRAFQLTDKGKLLAVKHGYSVNVYCPNKQCENSRGGLFSGRLKDVQPAVDVDDVG